jgi:O-antigen/teichoic acid export membrane protein
MQAKKLTSNFLIQSLGKVGSVVIGLLVVALLTRHLGQSGYGEYTTAITFLQMFGVVVDFGLTLTLNVMLSEEGSDQEKVAGNILSLRLLSGALVFGIAPLVVLGFPWSATIKLAVAVGAVAYFFMSGATMLVGIYQRHAVMWRAALSELVNRLVLLGFIFAFVQMGYGVVAMIGALIVSNIVYFGMMIRLARPYVEVKPKINTRFWKKAIKKSWPIGASIFFNLLYLQGDILFLAWFREQAEVGVYGVSYKVIDVLTAMATMLMGLILPTMVKKWTGDDKRGFRKQLNDTFDIMVAAAIPVIVGAQAVAQPLLAFLAGNEFAVSGSVLRVLVIAILGVFIGTLYGHTVVALNKQKEMLWGYVAVAIVAIVGYLWLIPEYGMWGAAWVTIASEVLIAGLTFAMVWSVTRITPRLKTLILALISAGLMYVVLINLPDWHVLIHVAIGAAVYLVAMLISGGIPISLIKSLIPRRESTESV